MYIQILGHGAGHGQLDQEEKIEKKDIGEKVIYKIFDK